MKIHFLVGPVLQKEFRSRMRGWRSPLVISIYLGLLAGITYAYFYMTTQRMMYGGFFGPEVGLQMYGVLAIFQLMLVAFVTPALTAGVISGERERQTLPLLLCTRLSATSIVLSKLVASLSYILLLLIASLPVFSIVFLFGGVSPKELLQILAIYLMTALTLGSIGIFCSSVTRKTQVSTVLTYAIVFVLLIGTLMAGTFQMATNQGQPYVKPPVVIYANPLVALTSVLPQQYGSFGIPFIGPIYASPPTYPGMKPVKLLPAWEYNFIFDAVLIVVLLLASVLIIKPVKRWPRFNWRRSRGERVAPAA